MEIVCDMSSDIGSRKIDWNRFGCVYAGAQKNLGAAGCAVVIVREDLIGKHHADTPYLLDWELHTKSPDQFFNTPATYPIYVTGLNLEHMIKQGGVPYYQALAEQRSSLLYDFIDKGNGFYTCPVQRKNRSKINVVVRIKADPEENQRDFRRLELLFI